MAANPEPTPQEVRTPFQRRRNVAVAPRVPWLPWYDDFADTWQQDEHISLIGPNGTGKSTLSLELLKIRTYKVFLMTKPSDPKLEAALERQHYAKVPAFPTNPPDDVDRYLLWPPGSGEMTQEAHVKQRTVIRDAFSK